MRRLARPFLILLAIVFLFEAWLWRHLEPIFEWIVARIPLPALKVRFAAAIDRLPPAATLIVFVIPAVLLLPLKILGLWLFAHQHWFAGVLVLVLGKLVGMGVAAFVFEVTRPKLLRLAWFRWLYERVLTWLGWAHRLVDPIKHRIKALLRMLGPKRAGRMMRLFWRIRRRMRAARADT